MAGVNSLRGSENQPCRSKTKKPRGENEMKKMKYLRKRLLAAGVCLGTFAGGGIAAQAQDSQADAIAQLQKQNATLLKRLDALENTVDNQ
jgi:cell division protein FtsB